MQVFSIVLCFNNNKTMALTLLVLSKCTMPSAISASFFFFFLLFFNRTKCPSFAIHEIQSGREEKEFQVYHKFQSIHVPIKDAVVLHRDIETIHQKQPKLIPSATDIKNLLSKQKTESIPILA